MRKVVYTIYSPLNIDIESTFSYARALERLEEGCFFTTTIMNCANKLSPAERKAAAKRSAALTF